MKDAKRSLVNAFITTHNYLKRIIKGKKNVQKLGNARLTVAFAMLI